VADARDVRIAKLQEQLRRAEDRERQFGEIIAQQQTLIAAQVRIGKAKSVGRRRDAENRCGNVKGLWGVRCH
jgi:hypothetical protein